MTHWPKQVSWPRPDSTGKETIPIDGRNDRAIEQRGIHMGVGEMNAHLFLIMEAT